MQPSFHVQIEFTLRRGHPALRGMPTFKMVRASTSCCLARSLGSLSARNQSVCEAGCLKIAHEACSFYDYNIATQRCLFCAQCDPGYKDPAVASWSRYGYEHGTLALERLLNTSNYSRIVYKRQVQMRLRVLWLHLLAEPILLELGRIGVCKWSTSSVPWRPFFMALDRFANPLNALWVAGEEQPGLPMPSGSCESHHISIPAL